MKILEFGFYKFVLGVILLVAALIYGFVFYCFIYSLAYDPTANHNLVIIARMFFWGTLISIPLKIIIQVIK